VPTYGAAHVELKAAHNFHFTSQVIYWFKYDKAATARLDFTGDDDVWVFVNGKLVLDLGAPHERLQGTVTLTPTGATWAIQGVNVTTNAAIAIASSPAPVALNLVVGKTYEIAIFHADRHPRESNYQLTLSGYSTTRSVCTPRCGDAVATAGEECDVGDQNNDTEYGGCTTACKFGPFCGDSAVTAEKEECDQGKNNTSSVYGTGPGGCTLGCKNQHYCGDGIVDGAFQEECDAGAANSDNGQAQCTSKCKLNIIAK
jgi:fibro-slime domain-containing protein